MKNLLRRGLCVLLTAVCLLASAQPQRKSYYYYYHGERVPLYRNPGTVTVVEPHDLGKYWPHIRVTGMPQHAVPSSVRLDLWFPGRYFMTYIYVAENPGTPLDTAALLKAHATGSFVQPCYKNADGSNVRVTNRLCVRLRDEKDLPRLRREARRMSLLFEEEEPFIPLWYMLDVTEQTGLDVVEASAALYETGLFAAEPEFYGEPDTGGISDDPEAGDQWGLYNAYFPGTDMDVATAWDYATGLGVVVAMIDCGVHEHPDITGSMHALGYDAFNNASPAQVWGLHGTECAGIIAATRNNGAYLAGVAPDARIMSVSSKLNTGDLTESVRWAWQHGAQVLNCSWHCQQCNHLEEALDSAMTHGRSGLGCVVVKSAGNDNSVSYPGGYSHSLLLVNAVDSSGCVKPAYAKNDEHIDVVAPGFYVKVLYRNAAGQYTTGWANGTSLSAAAVSGVAALVLEADPFLTGQQVRDIIERNTKKVGPDGTYATVAARPNGTWSSNYGYGLVDAAAAVQDAANGWFTREGGSAAVAQARSIGTDGATYDLQGRHVERPSQRGIYLRGGRKYVVR